VVGHEAPDQPEFANVAAFLRATALEKAGRHAEAWKHLGPANRAMFLANQSEFGELTGRQRANLARLRESQAKAECDDESPISLFILGPSRSGKTTLEKLVSTLGDVKRGFENLILRNVTLRACESAGLPPDISFENLPASLHPLCREIYRNELIQRIGNAKVFTNTNPGHIHYADLIAAVFPKVRFLLVKRDVEDNALRIYMRKYDAGHLYSYDLQAARDHIVWYHQMMDLLAEKFAEIARVIHYEEMVANPPTTLRIAADLCGLSIRNSILPALGDDRGCAAPYRSFMATALGS
jgi:hypothetical protein